MVITRGEKGSIAVSGKKIFECEGRQNLNIVDLTGAGDLFASGFLHSYCNGKTISEGLHSGTEMASKIIQTTGARLK